MRSSRQFKIHNHLYFKEKAFFWSQKKNVIAYLDSNQYSKSESNFDVAIAIGAHKTINMDYKNAFETLKLFYENIQDWIFGYFSYDLKNDTEILFSNNDNGLGFLDLYFFQPKKLIFIRDQEVIFLYLKEYEIDIQSDFEDIQNTKKKLEITSRNNVKLTSRLSKKEYLDKINEIKKYIARGDIYEVNFCTEFYANVHIHPAQIFQELNQFSKTPFATFLKCDNLYAMSASPERFLKKQGKRLISQPIKGTLKRFISNDENLKAIAKLKNNQKELSENIMITDLVRNDLSKIAQKGSVKVEELCGAYSFEYVHQLISTVSCLVKDKVHPVDIIKSLFPMASMTGVPKIRAMEIIEELECHRRGLYSGSIGYFTPNGDFDFNVVIRTILYNDLQKYISLSGGGAITMNSNPDSEYNEVILKIESLKDILFN